MRGWGGGLTIIIGWLCPRLPVGPVATASGALSSELLLELLAPGFGHRHATRLVGHHRQERLEDAHVGGAELIGGFTGFERLVSFSAVNLNSS